MNFFQRAIFKLQQTWWSRKVRHAGEVLQGDQAWSAMDRLRIQGFGTHLLRLDFPPLPPTAPSWAPGGLAHQRLTALLDRDRALQDSTLAACATHAATIAGWPRTAADAGGRPWHENEFLSGADMTLLYGVLRQFRPARYIEIGCGISTRVTLAAIADGKLDTEIVCIDPTPRVNFPAAKLRHIPRRLEETTEEIIRLATPGSVLFFDGSHRSFPGSDVTVFFLNILPALGPGVIVHIHDIFLPDDYPQPAAERYWSEQYLLATWLLGGALGFEVLLPGARLETRAGSRELLPSPAGRVQRCSSFWLRTQAS